MLCRFCHLAKLPMMVNGQFTIPWGTSGIIQYPHHIRTLTQHQTKRVHFYLVNINVTCRPLEKLFWILWVFFWGESFQKVWIIFSIYISKENIWIHPI